MTTILIIILIVLLIGGLPSAGLHSFGYGPSGLVAVVLVVLLVMLLMGRL